MRIHLAAEVRDIDRHAAEQLHLPTALLMENAGAAVSRHVPTSARRVVVVCGKGNNGGDGAVAARHLRVRGVDVACLWMSPVDELKGDAHAAAQAAIACGVPGAHGLDDLGAGDVVVDALFGTGLTRAPEGRALELVRAIEAARVRGAFVVSVDVPSGIDADRARAPGECVRADCTVTLHSLKPAHVQHPARALCGDVVLESIGLPPVHQPGPVRRWLTRAHVASLLPRRPQDAHKGTNGHVLVVAGSPGKSGAARLVCEGALHSGAGLVTLASSSDVTAQVVGALPEAMSHPLDAITGDGLLMALGGKDVLVLGPGIRRGEATGSLIVELLSHIPLPTVLDADGLNALAAVPDTLRHLPGAQVAPVLTPHPAELGRLLGIDTADVQADRLGAASEAARRFRAHVVLKGANTVVAHPDGALEVNSTGNPAMATGGTGDVLAGVIGALLGQGLSPGDAAVVGTWAHGRAGDLEARDRERGLLATGLARRLPEAFGELQ